MLNVLSLKYLSAAAGKRFPAMQLNGGKICLVVLFEDPRELLTTEIL